MSKSAIAAAFLTAIVCVGASAQQAVPPPINQTCGTERFQVRIGVMIERVSKCWASFWMFRKTGELMRGNVIVSVYEMPYDSNGHIARTIGVGAIYVVDGKVVAWTQ